MAKEKSAYPVHLKGEIDKPSRALWLVKWFLAIPHWIVLAFLCIAFAILTIIAFFAILFTGRYPQGIFNFNVGVLRWGWRVFFYAAVLGTDKYPPFTLEPVADYPADLNVEYPAKLSQGLVWIKWWLLAIPQYIIVAFFQGGGHQWRFGLIHVISIFAGVGVLFTGKYQPDFFKFVMGMNRWSYRVLAYALLMTDKYPPFRLD